MADDAASLRSRYKDAPVFEAGTSDAYVGLPDLPPEFARLSPQDYRAYEVTAADVGFPDRVAALFFGDGFEDLWWVVAAVNGIIDPETELTAGRVLRVPPRSAVELYVSRLPAQDA